MALRVLITDDHASVRKALRSFIEEHRDYQVCGEAEDGSSAVELARKLQPDAIVLDFAIPKLNGLDVAKRLAVVSPNTRIVLFTAHDSTLVRCHATCVGIQAVVAKDGKAGLQRLLQALRGDQPLAA